MTDIRPYARRPLVETASIVQREPTPTFALYALLLNGQREGLVMIERAQQEALKRRVMQYLADGWQVRRFTPDFAQVWRHVPAEMVELELREVE